MTKRYHPPLPTLSDLYSLFSFWPDYQKLMAMDHVVDRICADRLLLIRERLLDQGLVDGSILDLGGGTGYFSFALYILNASQVDLVEDERARSSGYGDESFANEIRSRIVELDLKNLFVHDQPIETFLEQHAGSQSWDVTLCLSVLHHFINGYGDNPEVGRRSYSDVRKIFRQIGKVTKRCAYIELDGERVESEAHFLEDLLIEGGFSAMRVIGISHSAIGVPRNVVEFLK